MPGKAQVGEQPDSSESRSEAGKKSSDSLFKQRVRPILSLFPTFSLKISSPTS